MQIRIHFIIHKTQLFRCLNIFISYFSEFSWPAINKVSIVIQFYLCAILLISVFIKQAILFKNTSITRRMFMEANLNLYVLFHTFFFCLLKLSMITPMNRLRVKNDPKMMNKTKYMYIILLISLSGCWLTWLTQRYKN